MNIPTDVKASIDKHLQAVRANLSDKEESIQNEILEGLRDHINETLIRGGKPITTETVEAIIAAMDDPSSYAEEPTLAATTAPKRAAGMSGNKWLYVAVAFLSINSIGVWKLFQIEQKTGSSDGQSAGGNAQLVVPHVASANKKGIRYPESDKPATTTENTETKAAVTEENSFRSIAFLENLNPVLQKSDQELSWRFNVDVVAQTAVGKPLTEAPLKMSPEVPGEFTWQSPKQLIFKAKDLWKLDQSFTAEMASDFKAIGGELYEGSRFWRFSTAAFGVEKFTQSPKRGRFLFNMTFPIPAKPESLKEKLKLFYLNANGERFPLYFTATFDQAGTTATLETPIVPAISFECEVDANLQAQNWSDGTRGKIDRKLPNSQLLSLSAVSFEQRTGEKPTIMLVFSEAPSDVNLSNFIEITPKVAVTLARVQGRPQILRLSGDFIAGIAYEIKVRSGITSDTG